MLAEQVNERTGAGLSARTVRWHIGNLGLANIRNTLPQLVEALKAYDGTLIFVAHDRWFVSQLATRILEITEDALNDYSGTYDEYLADCGDDHLDVDAATLRAFITAARAEWGVQFVLLGGTPISAQRRADIARRIAYVPQGREVFPLLTVEENLKLAQIVEPHGWSIDRLYELFPRLGERRKQEGTTMSGGEQQMLAIARALARDVKLLLLDEPYEGLAPVIVDEIEKTLRLIKEQGMTTILVEQNAVRALQLADRAIIEITGNETLAFLQDLITADVENLKSGEAAHGGLLTPQGKILFDFFVLASEAGVLIDCAREQRDTLLQRLIIYKLRLPLGIAARDDLSVAVCWDGKPEEVPEGVTCFADPRLASLGWRLVGPASSLASLESADADAYRQARYRFGLADSLEIGSGELFPHEANYDQYGSVNFKKGCYVGQEVVSRMQHRGTARSRTVT